MAGEVALGGCASCELQDCPLLAGLKNRNTHNHTVSHPTRRTKSGWQLFLITLEQKNKNKHQEHESAAHRVSRLTTYRVLFVHTFI